MASLHLRVVNRLILQRSLCLSLHLLLGVVQVFVVVAIGDAPLRISLRHRIVLIFLRYLHEIIHDLFIGFKLCGVAGVEVVLEPRNLLVLILKHHSGFGFELVAAKVCHIDIDLVTIGLNRNWLAAYRVLLFRFDGAVFRVHILLNQLQSYCLWTDFRP